MIHNDCRHAMATYLTAVQARRAEKAKHCRHAMAAYLTAVQTMNEDCMAAVDVFADAKLGNYYEKTGQRRTNPLLFVYFCSHLGFYAAHPIPFHPW